MGATVLRVVRMTNKCQGFYQSVGPFLSRRSIVAEIGGPLWDDDGKEWYVAWQGRVIVGIAAIKRRPGMLSFTSAYVPQHHRMRGVYRALLDARVSEAVRSNLPARAVATHSSVHALERAGFKVTSSRGRFTVMERLP